MTLTPADEESETQFDTMLRNVARVGLDEHAVPLPQPGQLLGDKYRIEALLGQGGMGAVFRAVHVVSRKPVAIKWMLRSLADDAARGRFVREARAAGRIDHPNVVNVYDVGEQGPACYLVMELLHGETLRERLKRDGRLPVRTALELLVPAMRGVAAVHHAGVVHRDLKPDNIYLCRGPTGAPREAKVLDFGISAMVERDFEDTTLTAEGMLLGTPAYMSPEQLRCARSIDLRADVYAFGVILYEVLTGKQPFEADGYAALVLAVAGNKPVSPRALCPDLHPDVERVVMRALAKRREDRYSDVETMLADLARSANAEVSGRRRWQPTRRATVSMLAASLLCALGAAVGRPLRMLDPGPARPVAALKLEVGLAPRPVEGLAGDKAPPADAAVLTPATSVVAHEATPPAPTLPRKRPVETARAIVANRPAPDAVKVPTSIKQQPACDPPYLIDASEHILFKLECM